LTAAQLRKRPSARRTACQTRSKWASLSWKCASLSGTPEGAATLHEYAGGLTCRAPSVPADTLSAMPGWPVRAFISPRAERLPRHAVLSLLRAGQTKVGTRPPALVCRDRQLPARPGSGYEVVTVENRR